MKVIIGLKFAVLLAVASLVLALQVDTPKAVAQAEEPEQTQAQEQQPAAVYSYVAQPGDSYSLMARKAVQTYGLAANVALSPAAIIFAETHLTQEAGASYLAVGQAVEIAEPAVQKWVEAAQQLTDAQEAAWAYYAQFADFNTNAVGEAQE